LRAVKGPANGACKEGGSKPGWRNRSILTTYLVVRMDPFRRFGRTHPPYKPVVRPSAGFGRPGGGVAFRTLSLEIPLM
jgi:hypothetical protein